jgi:hypothetical protein
MFLPGERSAGKINLIVRTKFQDLSVGPGLPAGNEGKMNSHPALRAFLVTRARIPDRKNPLLTHEP